LEEVNRPKIKEKDLLKKCKKCGEPIYLPYTCPYCGGEFCYEHSRREKHDCVLSPTETKRLAQLGALEPQLPLPAVKGEAAVSELNEILRFEKEFDDSLNDILENRLDQTLRFGKQFSVNELALYLTELFGSVLFFDSLLAIVQQYSIADVEVVSKPGKSAMRTGLNLALFGQPGTGKTFAALDMIVGKPRKGVLPHGLPGRNRYCGGMTPALFIEVGQAYQDRKFNFIVTEFNDWFKYKGMVEPLKLALEQGIIKKETMRGTVGPYKFTSFFSVNYNTKVQLKGYKTTVGDPNFNAIEDRMLCRLHRLTRKRFEEIAGSAMKFTLGEVSMDKASSIRDHLTLVHAIATRHPRVKDMFPYKTVLLTRDIYEKIVEAREAILEYLKYSESLDFSPRLEMRAIQLACAMSLLSYFRDDEEYIKIDQEAIRLAIKFYVEEASVRSKEEFKPEWVLYDLGIYKPSELKKPSFQDEHSSDRELQRSS
jgi:hypothetical protein